MLKAHCSKVHGNAAQTVNKATSYDCKVCSLKFISFSGLSRHQKVKHGIRSGGSETNSSQNSGRDIRGIVNAYPGPPPSSVEIDVSSTSTAVTINVPMAPMYPDSAPAASSDAPVNKSLSEEDFLQDMAEAPPAPMDAGGGGGGGGSESFKCGNCFLFFDDPTDFSQHRASCG